MRRHSLSRRRSKRLFKKTAMITRRKNVARNMRGGIRA